MPRCGLYSVWNIFCWLLDCRDPRLSNADDQGRASRRANCLTALHNQGLTVGQNARGAARGYPRRTDARTVPGGGRRESASGDRVRAGNRDGGLAAHRHSQVWYRSLRLTAVSAHYRCADMHDKAGHYVTTSATLLIKTLVPINSTVAPLPLLM